MSTHQVFNGCDDAVKADLEAYWAKKLPKLQKLLVHYRPDLQEIWLTVYRHPRDSQREWYEVRGAIHLPTGTLAAEAEEKDPRAALGSVADKLAAEIKRHKAFVRHDYVYKRKARRRADLSAAEQMLQRDAENGRREDFFRLLRPLLGFLAAHARRELRTLELDGTLHRGEVTVADLLDEVLVLAWERFADRPRHLSLDLWLIDLLHETLERLVKQEPRPHVSLADRAEEALPREARRGEEPVWWAELLGYDEKFTVEDLIPDWDGTEIWDDLEAEEQRDWILSLLGELPAARRQAFLLHALEDYDLMEIAMLQDRPESEVKADIEAARQTLHNRLLAGGRMQEAATAGGN